MAISAAMIPDKAAALIKCKHAHAMLFSTENIHDNDHCCADDGNINDNDIGNGNDNYTSSNSSRRRQNRVYPVQVPDRNPQEETAAALAPAATTAMPPAITFENVQFAYPTRPDARVLSGLNVTIKVRVKATTHTYCYTSGGNTSTEVTIIATYSQRLCAENACSTEH